jgi:hypothetical protein
VTLAQALDFLRNRHNEAGYSLQYWGDTELYALISARAQVLAAILGLIEDTDTATTTVASTQAYDWPSDASAVVKVLYDGTALKQTTFEAWELEKSSGTTPEGTPERYLNWNRQVILIPTPDAAETLTFYYEPYHPWITTSAGTITVPAELHAVIMDGCLGDMYAKIQNAQMCQLYEGKWNQHLATTVPQYKVRVRYRDGVKTVIDADTNPQTGG